MARASAASARAASISSCPARALARRFLSALARRLSPLNVDFLDAFGGLG